TGELREGWYRYSLKIQSRIQSLADVRAVPLLTLGTGKVLTLGQVADVRLAESDPTYFSLVDVRKVLSVLVKKEYGANTVEAYDTLVPLLGQLRAQNPDIGLRVLSENATFIRNAINNLLQTLLYGAVLAFVILFLFLDDWRTPFTIGLAIPVSIFLTFFVMYVSDIQLNIISLSGLTLGIGLLVDNAIIVLENINRHRSGAASVFEAADLGTREIGLAVTASTLTTISVFLPLVFIGGFEGAFCEDQAWTLSISLLASLGVALLILPVLVTQVQQRGEGQPLLGFNHFFDAVLGRYEQSLQWALRNKILLAAVAGGLLVAGGFLFMMTNKRVLPQTQPEQVRYRVVLPGNTSLRATRAAAEAFIRSVRPAEGKGRPARAIGGYTDQTNLANLADEGLNKFTASFSVDGFRQAEKVRQQAVAFFEEHPGWRRRKIASQQSLSLLPGGQPPPVVFQLVGRDRGKSEQLAAALEEELQSAGWDITLAKQYEQELATYQLQFKSRQMLQLGVSEAEVIRYLESLTRGSHITDWNRQDENVPSRLVGYDRQIFDPADITLEINNLKIPLTQL